MINSWQTITRGSCVSKAWKPPSSRPILIYFEFRSKPSLITVICMDPHSPNKLFATKYCFLILGDEFLFLNHFFVFRFFFFVILCYFVIINFYKNYVIIIILFIYFFSWKLLLFFHVPGSSEMFRVPGFIDARGGTGSSAILIKQGSVNRANGFLRKLGRICLPIYSNI